MKTASNVPAARDFDSIAGTLPSNALSDGGNEPIVVRHPSAEKGDLLHQGARGAVIHRTSLVGG